MTTHENPLGFLRSCMDKRFVASTRTAFEQASGLGPADYWHEAYAGGSAINPPSDTGLNYVLQHTPPLAIFGWQAHINVCGGQPGVSDQTITNRLNRMVVAMIDKIPSARHFRVLASETGVDVKEFSPVVAIPSQFPPFPNDCGQFGINGEVNPTPSQCRAVNFCGYTYWAPSFSDNRIAMAILAYDANNNLVQRWEKPGARYLSQISIDQVAKTVIFSDSQQNTQIVMSWNELIQFAVTTTWAS